MTKKTYKKTSADRRTELLRTPKSRGLEAVLKVTIDRVLRLVEGAGLEADILRRSPANARRLQKATADAAARRFVRSPRG